MAGSGSGGATILLDQFAGLKEQLVGNRAAGKELQSDIARMASLMGKFAVSVLDQQQQHASRSIRPAWAKPLRVQFVIGFKKLSVRGPSAPSPWPNMP